MSRDLNYKPVAATIFSISVSIGALLYAAAVFAQEAAAPAQAVPESLPVPVQAPPPAQTPAPTDTNPAASSEAESTAKKEDVAPKPALSPEKQKELRDEIIYRTNLGRGSDVKILLKEGASVNETNDSGVPLISLASARTDVHGLDIVKALVEAGADINKVDPRGKTALFYAAKSGNKNVVEYLLSKKIKYSAVDSAGNNARVIAYQTGNNEIVEILDNFVRGQNDVVRKQYDEANKEIAEKYKEYNDKIQEQMKKETDEQNKIKLATSQTSAIQDTVRSLSFASCSAAYWEFCNTAKQQTQFGAGREIVNNINAQNTHANEFLNTLIRTYYVRSDVAQNILTVSADTIKSQLAEYPSNEARKDDGVGTIDDMNRRCAFIADTWQATPKKADSGL